MKTNRNPLTSRKNAERGEGNGKLIAALVVAAYLGYVAVQNVPIWMQVTNIKHDMDEIARSSGAQNQPVVKVQYRVQQELIREYGIPSEAVTVKKDGPNLTLSLSMVKQLKFIFKTYDWQITHSSAGKAM